MTPRPRKPYIASVPPVVMAECREILARQLAGGVGQGGVGKRGRPTLASQRAAHAAKVARAAPRPLADLSPKARYERTPERRAAKTAWQRAQRAQRAAIRDGNAAPAMARRLARTNDGENGGASVA